MRGREQRERGRERYSERVSEGDVHTQRRPGQNGARADSQERLKQKALRDDITSRESSERRQQNNTRETHTHTSRIFAGMIRKADTKRIYVFIYLCVVYPCCMPAQSLEVRAARPPHGHVGVKPGTKDAGKERHVPVVAVARVSPAVGKGQLGGDDRWSIAG